MQVRIAEPPNSRRGLEVIGPIQRRKRPVRIRDMARLRRGEPPSDLRLVKIRSVGIPIHSNRALAPYESAKLPLGAAEIGLFGYPNLNNEKNRRIEGFSENILQNARNPQRC